MTLFLMLIMKAVTNPPFQVVVAPGSSSQQYSQSNDHAQPVVAQSFSQKVAWAFDPLWCAKQGLDIDALGWTTKLKFDALFVQGVFHVNDWLIVNAGYKNHGAEVPTQICFQVMSKGCAAVRNKQLTGLAVLQYGTAPNSLLEHNPAQSTDVPHQDPNVTGLLRNRFP